MVGQVMPPEEVVKPYRELSAIIANLCRPAALRPALAPLAHRHLLD
jgi:hypothetical protein